MVECSLYDRGVQISRQDLINAEEMTKAPDSVSIDHCDFNQWPILRNSQLSIVHSSTLILQLPRFIFALKPIKKEVGVSNCMTE